MAKLSAEEIAGLEAAKNGDEYSVLARAIKKTHGNAYPEDWWAVVMMPGGISERLKVKWADPHAFDISVSTPTTEELKNGQ